MVMIDSLRSLLVPGQTILGLDAYGVIYNDDGLFEPVKSVVEFCHNEGIELFVLTNNAVQTLDEISAKLVDFGLPILPDHIISSGCGCYLLEDVQALLKNKKTFVYGSPSSQFYPKKAGAHLVQRPEDAQVIVFSASLQENNHGVYKQVHDVLLDAPNMPVICINPDHYVMNSDGLKPVMGFYAHQMACQLDRSDWVWMGKPFQRFSALVQTVFHDRGLDPSRLVFCDDNPHNVRQLSQDLNAQGVVISGTGIAHRYALPKDPSLFQLPVCKLR